MVILLFSFLVILYRFLGIHENAYHIRPFGARACSEAERDDAENECGGINPPHQFEVHLHYPRVAHPMFWEGRILLVPLVVFPPFPLDPQGHPFHQ